MVCLKSVKKLKLTAYTTYRVRLCTFKGMDSLSGKIRGVTLGLRAAGMIYHSQALHRHRGRGFCVGSSFY